MTRGKPTSEDTKAKVVELKTINPELSSHDIEKMLDGTEHEVSNDTICDILNKLPQIATTEKGAKQIERLTSIIDGIEDITSKVVTSLYDKEDHTVYDVKLLNDISKTNFERLRLLQDKSTSNIGVSGLKNRTTEDLLRELEE